MLKIVSQIQENKEHDWYAIANNGIETCSLPETKLRRAYSLEDLPPITEESENSEELWSDPEEFEVHVREKILERRMSFPLCTGVKEQILNEEFSEQIMELKLSMAEQLDDNCYADSKPPKKVEVAKKPKTVARATQTYLRDLLNIDPDSCDESEMEVVLEDEAELDPGYAKNLIDDVLEYISESESEMTRRTNAKKRLAAKRMQEIPEFELSDILGDFEIDDLGNFIILEENDVL